MFSVLCQSTFLTIMVDNDIKLVEEMVVLEEPCFPRVMITVGQESNFCMNNIFYIKQNTGIYIASIPKIRNHQRAITIYIAECDQNLPNYISEYPKRGIWKHNSLHTHLDHIHKLFNLYTIYRLYHLLDSPPPKKTLLLTVCH